MGVWTGARQSGWHVEGVQERDGGWEGAGAQLRGLTPHLTRCASAERKAVVEAEPANQHFSCGGLGQVCTVCVCGHYQHLKIGVS